MQAKMLKSFTGPWLLPGIFMASFCEVGIAHVSMVKFFNEPPIEKTGVRQRA